MSGRQGKIIKVINIFSKFSTRPTISIKNFVFLQKISLKKALFDAGERKERWNGLRCENTKGL
jgi:hypothetical protein